MCQMIAEISNPNVKFEKSFVDTDKLSITLEQGYANKY